MFAITQDAINSLSTVEKEVLEKYSPSTFETLRIDWFYKGEILVRTVTGYKSRSGKLYRKVNHKTQTHRVDRLQWELTERGAKIGNFPKLMPISHNNPGRTEVVSIAVDKRQIFPTATGIKISRFNWYIADTDVDEVLNETWIPYEGVGGIHNIAQDHRRVGIDNQHPFNKVVSKLLKACGSNTISGQEWNRQTTVTLHVTKDHQNPHPYSLASLRAKPNHRMDRKWENFKSMPPGTWTSDSEGNVIDLTSAKPWRFCTPENYQEPQVLDPCAAEDAPKALSIGSRSFSLELEDEIDLSPIEAQKLEGQVKQYSDTAMGKIMPPKQTAKPSNAKPKAGNKLGLVSLNKKQ
jgi:hypothetical protein